MNECHQNKKICCLRLQNYKKNIKSISFCIGIDSLASVSGALSGDLDPSNGMYWAWQSGYINMKIEGTSSSCKTRKNSFNFHIGGYLKPYNAIKKIEIPINKIQNQIIDDLERLGTKIIEHLKIDNKIHEN